MDKSMLTIETWQRIAFGDLLADKFNELLQVNKGLHAFQEFPNLALNEATYRAQIALLNASLIHQFDGACFNMGSKRLQENFAKFDGLIAASELLPSTLTLVEFQRYAKSSFYYRIGDYLLMSMKSAPDPFDKNQFVAALCMYSIALNHQCSGSDSVHWPAEAFNILELKILLTHNLSFVNGLSVIVENLRNNKLASYVSSLVFGQKNAVGQFLKSDLPKHAKVVDLQKINSQQLAGIIWQVRRHGIFLKRFLWIRARLGLTEDSFLNNSVKRCAFPQSFASAYEVQDFSLFDLKLLIYRMSTYAEALEIKPKTLDKTFLYAPHFQPLSNKKFWNIWTIVNTLLDNGTYRHEKAGDRINFVSMLEEIRQIVVYDSDKANLTKTANYILETIVRSEDLLPKVSQMLVELFERYANFVLNPKYTPQTSALFPPYGEYSDLEEQKIKDTANYLLARYAVQTSDFSKASDYVAKISEAGLTKEGVKELMEKIQQRDSKNASPNSVDGFQMVDEVRLEVVEESTLDDTFVSCNQSSKQLDVSSPQQASTIVETTQRADDTIDVSKMREEVEADVKKQSTRHLLSTILDNFIDLSIHETQKLLHRR